MNKEIFIVKLTVLRRYLLDVLIYGLDGHKLDVVERELYKIHITNIDHLIDFLKR